MGIVDKIKKLGCGYIFERVFERIVPVWMFRFCSLAVYQIDLSKLSGGPFSNADIKICDSTQELGELRKVTFADGAEGSTIGFVATVDREVAGGLWVAIGDFQDGDLGLSFMLGQEGTWIYGARVDDAYRRQGIYSHLMDESTQSRKNAGHAEPYIGVSKLNQGSHKAIQRFGTLVGQVSVIRLGSIVWARAKGDLKQDQDWTFQCTRRPIQLRLPEH